MRGDLSEHVAGVQVERLVLAVFLAETVLVAQTEREVAGGSLNAEFGVVEVVDDVNGTEDRIDILVAELRNDREVDGRLEGPAGGRFERTGDLHAERHFNDVHVADFEVAVVVHFKERVAQAGVRGDREGAFVSCSVGAQTGREGLAVEGFVSGGTGDRALDVVFEHQVGQVARNAQARVGNVAAGVERDAVEPASRQKITQSPETK